MSKEHVVKLVLEMYQNNKQTREYLEYWLEPNEKEKLEYYRKVIIEEFYPTRNVLNPKLRFSACKKAITEFRALQPDPPLLADLLITLPETACKFTNEFGDMWEQYYDSAATNFNIALLYMQKNGLLQTFKKRCENCVKYAEPCGYGFSEEIGDLYHEYYSDEE